VLSLVVLLLATSGVLHAQRRSTPERGIEAPREMAPQNMAPRNMAPHNMAPRNMEPRNMEPRGRTDGEHPRVRTEPALSLGGRWWDEKHSAKTYHLRPEQAQRMDAVLNANKDRLFTLYANLEHEKQQFAAMPREDLRDEAKVFAQIDRIALARADLEKANFHTQMQIRAQLDPDQLAALDKTIADAVAQQQ
ncbi:MAG: hypothetical protein ABI142_06720, partial [Bryocella sp.]